MRRLKDFASIAAFFSDQEIDELQAAVDARREARGGGPAITRRRTSAPSELPPRSRGPRKEEGVRYEARDGGFRDDARRLLRASCERQVAGGGRVTHVDLGAGPRNAG